jgi:hypothetical protein
MGITFKGHTPDYNFWVFDIDGKTFLARNNSTQSPLRLNFKDGRFFGNYSIDKIIPGAVLVKVSGFDIISGTSQTSGNSAGMVLNGIVEWTWAGQKYRNRWTLTEGMELSPAIPEEGVEGTYAYDLDIQPPYTPYDGPAGGSVGTGVTSQATIAAGKTKDEREAAEAAAAMRVTSTPTQIVASAQLSTAAPEQQYPLPMSVTSRPVTSGIATPTAIQAAQSGAMTKDEREALEAATTQISPSAQLSTAAPEQQYPLPMTVASRPVTAGIASPAAIQAAQSGAMTKDQREALAGQSGEAIQETQDAIAAAFKALSVSKSQGTVNVNAFNNARTELKNAKDALAVAQSRATSGEQVLMSQLQEQVDTIQGEVDIQLRYLQGAAQPVTKPVSAGIVSNAAIAQSNKTKEDIEASTAYKTPGYVQPVYPSQVTPPATYTPASTGLPRMTGMTTSPVIIPGTKDAREAAETAAAAGTDWVKLGLQIGAAYLLFS